MQNTETKIILTTSQLKELGELEMTPITLAKISLLNRELATLLAKKRSIAEGFTDPTVDAARAALVNIDWDGSDPRPVGGLVLVLADELNAVGHSYKNISTMLKNIGDHVATV